MLTSNQKTIAAVTHLSTLSQYVFPFGNFVFPIIIWSVSKTKSTFADHHGRQAINFQLSILLYGIVLAAIAIPLLLVGIFEGSSLSFINEEIIMERLTSGKITTVIVIAILAIFLLVTLKVIEFFLVINAAAKAANGELYQYPLTIPFIASTPPTEITASHTLMSQ